MTGRQKFLMATAYKYCPQYDILNDRDRDVFTLRVWMRDFIYLAISDVPSLAGTNQFQVRVCEQSKSYFTASPRVGELDKLFGKSKRPANQKYSIADANKIVDVLSNMEFKNKIYRNKLEENAVWVHCPRDVWY
jgi:hypothetical protein